jgi:hypothetical protein
MIEYVLSSIVMAPLHTKLYIYLVVHQNNARTTEIGQDIGCYGIRFLQYMFYLIKRNVSAGIRTKLI